MPSNVSIWISYLRLTNMNSIWLYLQLYFTTSYLYYPDSTSAGWTTALTNGTTVSSMTIRDPYRGLGISRQQTQSMVCWCRIPLQPRCLGRVISRNDDIFATTPFRVDQCGYMAATSPLAYDGIGKPNGPILTAFSLCIQPTPLTNTPKSYAPPHRRASWNMILTESA